MSRAMGAGRRLCGARQRWACCTGSREPAGLTQCLRPDITSPGVAAHHHHCRSPASAAPCTAEPWEAAKQEASLSGATARHHRRALPKAAPALRPAEYQVAPEHAASGSGAAAEQHGAAACGWGTRLLQAGTSHGAAAPLSGLRSLLRRAAAARELAAGPRRTATGAQSRAGPPSGAALNAGLRSLLHPAPACRWPAGARGMATGAEGPGEPALPGAASAVPRRRVVPEQHAPPRHDSVGAANPGADSLRQDLSAQAPAAGGQGATPLTRPAVGAPASPRPRRVPPQLPTGGLGSPVLRNPNLARQEQPPSRPAWARPDAPGVLPQGRGPGMQRPLDKLGWEDSEPRLGMGVPKEELPEGPLLSPMDAVRLSTSDLSKLLACAIETRTVLDTCMPKSGRA